MGTNREDVERSKLVQHKITNRLLAAQLWSEMTQAELILLLESTGATNQEIAEVLGTTAPTVSNVFVRARKKAKTKKARGTLRRGVNDGRGKSGAGSHKATSHSLALLKLGSTSDEIGIALGVDDSRVRQLVPSRKIKKITLHATKE